MTETVCQEAERIVQSDRGPQYGPPTVNFERIAQLWETYLNQINGDRKPGHFAYVRVRPQDVAILNIFQKVARYVEGTKRDHIVDIVGYAKTLAMVEGYE